LRDARIAPIYEGTNGIQAIDLVTRKLALQNGDCVAELIAELKQTAQEICTSNLPAYGKTGPYLLAAIEDLELATSWMQRAAGDQPDKALAGATHYLRLFGLTAGAGFLAQGTQAQSRKSDTSDINKHIELLRYLAEYHLPETHSLAATVMTSSDALLEITDEMFE